MVFLDEHYKTKPQQKRVLLCFLFPVACGVAWPWERDRAVCRGADGTQGQRGELPQHRLARRVTSGAGRLVATAAAAAAVRSAANARACKH